MTRFVVKTPAAVAGSSETTRQRSGRRGPVRLMPQEAAAERKPRAALTPPGMRWRFFGVMDFEELTGMNEMKGVVTRNRKMKNQCWESLTQRSFEDGETKVSCFMLHDSPFILCRLNQPSSFRKAHFDVKALNGLTSRPLHEVCLLYTSPSPRDGLLSRMPSSA